MALTNVNKWLVLEGQVPSMSASLALGLQVSPTVQGEAFYVGVADES